MRKALFATTFAATTLCLAAAAARADTPAFYVGAGVTQARLDNLFHSSSFNLDNTSWKVFTVWRPIPPLAIEAEYLDLGSERRTFSHDFGRVDAKAFGAFLVGYLPIPLPFIDFYGKVGAARWQLDRQSTSSLFAPNDRGTDFAWGGGVQGHLGKFAARLEYEQFSIRDTDGVKALTLGVSFNFM